MCVVKSAAAVSGFKFSVLSLPAWGESLKEYRRRSGRLGVAPRRESKPQQGLSCTRRHPGVKRHLTEIIEFFGQIVSSAGFHETILLNDETIFRFRADIRKQPLVISYPRSEHNAST
jgi:hypothetical protein